MKELFLRELKEISDINQKRLVVAELLQHMVLQSIYRNNFFDKIAFTGGTALRLLYHTQRFSEDLDFSVVSKKALAFPSLISSVQTDLNLQRIKCEASTKEENTVAQANVRFPSLLHELGISSHKNEKLTIKVEVDTNPPRGGNTEILLVAEPFSYTVRAFDLPSMFATKLHAIFHRKYTKGRDYYDLIWYLGRQLLPNFAVLNNAIAQTESKKQKLDEKNFKDFLLTHLATIDFKSVRKDVERFLINQEELTFLDFEPIKSLLRNYK